MAYARGRFGIEYQNRSANPDAPWLPKALAVVLAVALASLGTTLYSRFARRTDALALVPAAAKADLPRAPGRASPAATNAAAEETVVHVTGLDLRPARVRNLLMRLGAAEKQRNLEMAITTLEQLRQMPAAADLDNALARRLGTLNLRKLFEQRSPQWVTEATVRRGGAERVAAEHGATFASLERLNGARARSAVSGDKLLVMDHPRFYLFIYRVTRTADLHLNGKFFKRYSLTGPVSGDVGIYQLDEYTPRFLALQGIRLGTADQDELTMLLPRDTPVLISEFR